ncbi:MAG: M1 family aminopeptidase [Bacteroidota bacterium]
MMLKKYFFAIGLTLAISSCKIFKKSESANGNYPVVNLDTVETSAKTPEVPQYQASVTRINDIIHTKLDVSFDWKKQYLYGKATIKIKPYFYPTSLLQLNARGMEIKEIALLQRDYVKTGMDDKKDPSGNYEATVSETISKKPLEYTYEKDIITIKLDKEYKNTEEYSVFIDYISKPNELKKGGGSTAITDDKGLYFINPEGKEKNKPQQIWTQGETQSSSAWFPTIDSPNERMTQEIFITVDKKFVTLSNGELVFSTNNEDSTRTDCWQMDLPHAPYLAMMAVGEFEVVKDKWQDKEVNYYIEKEYAPYTKDIFGNTPEMLEFFSTKLGVPYAWNKYSQIIVRDYVSGAMENTTATLHGEFLQRTDRELLDKNYEDVISHELFHQWFGDLVTCESWSNLPLNESFATYGEYLWEEYKYGLDDADLHSFESARGYFAESDRKKVNLIRFQYDDKEDMFDAHSYNKGGQVLHMLRKYVGDAAFFASLKFYLETNKFTSVEIHNLRLAFEQVTGEDLNWFFNQWFLSSGHPDLIITTNYDFAGKKQKVEIKQMQDLSKTPLFKLPMAIDIYANGQKTRHKITVTKANETFEFDANTKPDLVNVDAEKMLLCTKFEEKTIKELAFQYQHAPLYLDRSEALAELAKNAKDSIATEIIISALQDKFWSIREDAIYNLKNIAPGREKQIKELLVQLVKTDKKSSVRAASIAYLSAFYKDEDLQTLYKTALNDRAYSVLGASLAAIAKANAQEGIKLAKQFENEKSNDVLFAIAELYANYGTDENNDFFVKSADKFAGFSKIGFVSLYGLYLKKITNNEIINSGVQVLKGIAEDENAIRWVAFYAKKSIKDLEIMYEERANENSLKLKTLKEKNPLAPEIKDLEKLIENEKAQKQKITEIYNGLK